MTHCQGVFAVKRVCSLFCSQSSFVIASELLAGPCWFWSDRVWWLFPTNSCNCSSPKKSFLEMQIHANWVGVVTQRNSSRGHSGSARNALSLQEPGVLTSMGCKADRSHSLLCTHTFLWEHSEGGSLLVTHLKHQHTSLADLKMTLACRARDSIRLSLNFNTPHPRNFVVGQTRMPARSQSMAVDASICSVMAIAAIGATS